MLVGDRPRVLWLLAPQIDPCQAVFERHDVGVCATYVSGWRRLLNAIAFALSDPGRSVGNHAQPGARVLGGGSISRAAEHAKWSATVRDERRTGFRRVCFYEV